MRVNDDYSYIMNKTLMEAGYTSLTVHSIHFDRFFTEEEKEKNRNEALNLSSSEWTKRCHEISRQLAPQMKEIITALEEKYDIHQTKPENATMEHYKSNWDLYFWSNDGIENPELDYFSLTFNSNRTPDENMALLNELRPLIESMEYKNIQCRIQYSSDQTLNQQVKTETEGLDIIKHLAETNKMINFRGMTGKVRKLNSYSTQEYGFFRKGAKTRYYSISPTDAILWKLEQEKEAN